MQKDIRKMMSAYKDENIELSSKHTEKFKALLTQEIHQQKPKKKSYKWVSIAASIVLLVSVGIHYYPTEKGLTKGDAETSYNNRDAETSSALRQISLGTISPELNTIETYYTNSIHLEISQLEITEQNKEMLDGYFEKIAELTKEYKSLTKELNTKGVNDATIDALISNLQLRLQLLKRLKKQLKDLQNLNSKQDETQQV